MILILTNNNTACLASAALARYLSSQVMVKITDDANFERDALDFLETFCPDFYTIVLFGFKFTPAIEARYCSLNISREFLNVASPTSQLRKGERFGPALTVKKMLENSFSSLPTAEQSRLNEFIEMIEDEYFYQNMDVNRPFFESVEDCCKNAKELFYRYLNIFTCINIPLMRSLKDLSNPKQKLTKSMVMEAGRLWLDAQEALESEMSW